MTIQHSAIADADRHEPKGITTAAAGSVYVSNGDTTSGTWIERVKRYSANVGTPAAVVANTTGAHSITVTGVATGDAVIGISKPTYQAGLGIVGWSITGADTVEVVFMNTTGSNITPTASEVYEVITWNLA